MKGNKGITLIALVITIIVLLILAGVSIAMLTGDNSLLGNAQKAGPYNDIGAAKDEIGLAYNSAMQQYYEQKYSGAQLNSTASFATAFKTAISPFIAGDADTKNSKNHGCKVEYNESDGTITITKESYKLEGTVNVAAGSESLKWSDSGITKK